MGAFQDALTQLAALTVSGVRANYGIAAVPDELSRAQLPALLVLPLTPQDRLFPERGDGFTALAFSNGARTVTYAVTHLLLVAPVTNGVGIRGSLPLLVTLMDAYFAALNPTLNGALQAPTQVRVEAGVFTHGTTPYYGCALRHMWVVQVY